MKVIAVVLMALALATVKEIPREADGSLGGPGLMAFEVREWGVYGEGHYVALYRGFWAIEGGPAWSQIAVRHRDGRWTCHPERVSLPSSGRRQVAVTTLDRTAWTRCFGGAR